MTASQLQADLVTLTPAPVQWEKVPPAYKPVIPITGSSGQPSRHSPGPVLPAEKDLLLLLDLAPLPPTDLRIHVNSSTGHKFVRFTNAIMNAGPGNIELLAKDNPGLYKETVQQYIDRKDGSTETVMVGDFFFDPEHDHWHLEDFANYEILSFGPDGEFNSVVASSDKISYCLRDDERANIPDAAVYQTYTGCDQERQGISAGWIDVYRYHLPGQSIDITFLPDGIYAFRTTVDPDNKLLDGNRANNVVVLYIEIEGNRVNILKPPFTFNDLSNVP